MLSSETAAMMTKVMVYPWDVTIWPPRAEDQASQPSVEDYHALKALRSAKRDPKNQKGQPFEKVARKLGLL